MHKIKRGLDLPGDSLSVDLRLVGASPSCDL